MSLIEWSNAIKNDSVLQAISILVALATVAYYVLKFVLFIGRSVWVKISPPLGRWIERSNERQRITTELAIEDSGFLILEIARRIIPPFCLLVMYFMLLIGGTSDGDDLKPPLIEWLARDVLIGASAFQLGSLHGWLTMIARKKLENHKNETG